MPTEEMTREEEFEEFRRSRYPDERSRELAQRRFAEERGETPTKAQATMIADAWLLGSGKMKTEGTQTFMDPQGFTRTYRLEDASIMSEGMPIHYSNRYSPYDQRKIEKLYQDRSRIATDPSLDEEARQRGLDTTNDQIHNVPMIAPMMRQPSAQDKFNASVIKTPGGGYATVNPRSGKADPIEPSSADAELRTAYSATLGKKLDALIQDNEALDVSKGAVKREFGDILADAELYAGLVHNVLGKPGYSMYSDKSDQPIAPVLEGAWNDFLYKMSTKRRKSITDSDIRTAMAEYIRAGVAEGLSPDIARVDFLQRWSRADGKILPEMKDSWQMDLGRGMVYLKSSERERAAQYAAQYDAQGKRIGGASVNGVEQAMPSGPISRVNGKIVPNAGPPKEGQVPVWNKDGVQYNVDATVKGQPLAEGYYTRNPTGPNVPMIDDKGVLVSVPAKLIDKALATGYKIAAPRQAPARQRPPVGFAIPSFPGTRR